MYNKSMRGVFPILITPFDEKYQIDEESLRRLIEFNIEAGVHGLGVALASEVMKLNEAERLQMTRIVVDQAKGRIPIVINTGAAGTDLAVHYSRLAEDNGANALMVLPPAMAEADEVVAYYRAISDAVNIPIFIQDILNNTVPPGLAKQIAQECEWVNYIKVESQPITQKVVAMKAAAGDDLIIFGGAGGGYFIEEMRRGSVGTMPFCTQPEAFVKIWDSFQAGDEETARQVFNQVLLPVSRVAGQGAGLFFAVHKEILRQRGIIRTAIVRRPFRDMDDLTRQELQQVIEQLYPQT